MNSSQLIERLNKFYDELREGKKYSFLIKGNWGIGKTYTYDEFVEKKSLEGKSYKYSLFGMKNLKELEMELLKESFIPTFEKLKDSSNKKAIWSLVQGLLSAGTGGATDKIMPSEVLKILSLKDLKYEESSIVCLDDFERSDISMKELMGFIERLKDKVNVVILCNEYEMEKKQFSEYEDYKEKVIDFTYSLEEVEDEIILRRLSELRLSDGLKKMILKEFKIYCKDNLRVLEKFIHLYRELSLDLEEIELENKFVGERLLKSCFYVVCENNLNLIEKFKSDKKKKYFSKDLLQSLMERGIENILNKETKKKENKYWVIYDVSESEVEEEVEKYFLGDKKNLEKIVKSFKVRARETERFMESELKGYFLLNSEGVADLIDNTEKFVEESNEENFPSLKQMMRFYSFYIYLCQKIKNEPNRKTTEKLEEEMSKFYKDEYSWVQEFESERFFMKGLGGIFEVFKEKVEDLKGKFKNEFLEENEKKVEGYLKGKKYLELSLELSNLLSEREEMPQIMFEYLKASFQRPITSDEWDLWHRIVENLKKEEDKEKINKILKEIKFEDPFAKERVKNLFKGKRNGIFF